jgi:hypothetical protein
VALTLLLVVATLFSSKLLRADVLGSILGVVHDRSQAAVAGAHIVVTNVQTNFSQEATSAADGSYRFLALPVGNYKVTATSAGFSQFVATDIDLKVNDQLHLDITLQVGNVKEEIIVSANAVQVEYESMQLGDVIESKKMLALPLNGRSYIDLLGLTAGVARHCRDDPPGRPVSGSLNQATSPSTASAKRQTPFMKQRRRCQRGGPTWARVSFPTSTRLRNSGLLPIASMPNMASSAAQS